MIKQANKWLKQKHQWLGEVAHFHNKALKHGKDLKCTQNRLKHIKRNDILLVCVLKNEAHRISYFLDYYRKLGVNHFIFVDNGSTDHLTHLVSGQRDITTFYSTASYKESNYGMYWANYLLLRFGRGHWCLTCDPDEFLVYPYIDTRDLRDLTDYLDSLREASFFTTMIDMYSDRPVEETHCPEGSDPLIACPYFDGTGYSKYYYAKYRNTFLQGGVRRRLFYADNPGSAPALNKIPLVKWQPHFAYVESMHMAIPRRLNEAVFRTKTMGALLHYKFTSTLRDKVREEEQAKQHWDNSSEYRKYGTTIQQGTLLYERSVSVRYEDWRTLARYGLVNVGEW
jgi:hypothetical protein